MSASGTPALTLPAGGVRAARSSRQAILAAASELLLDRGLNAISMDAVAERAGASKATIYRWWPSKELLALDALFSEWKPDRRDTPDTGTLAGDLLALIGPWVRQLAAKPYGRVIAALITRGAERPRSSPSSTARASSSRAATRPGRSSPVRSTATRSPADTDVEAALDLLYGPIYHRILHGHAPLTDRFARTVVDYVVAGVCRPAAS